MTKRKEHTLFRLQPDVEVCVDAHHQGADRSSRLEQQDPCTVKKEKDAEEKFDRTAGSFDVVDIIVQRLPQRCSEGIDHKQCVNKERNNDLEHETKFTA